MTLAERVRDLIKDFDQGSVRSAARRTGLKYGTIYDVQAGKSSNPSISTLERIAKAYGTSVAYLLHGEDGAPVAVVRGPPEPPPGEGTSPAHDAIRAVSHPLIARSRPLKARLLELYGYAFDNPHLFPPSELAIIHAWADLQMEILREQGNDGPNDE